VPLGAARLEGDGFAREGLRFPTIALLLVGLGTERGLVRFRPRQFPGGLVAPGIGATRFGVGGGGRGQVEARQRGVSRSQVGGGRRIR